MTRSPGAGETWRAFARFWFGAWLPLFMSRKAIIEAACRNDAIAQVSESLHRERTGDDRTSAAITASPPALSPDPTTADPFSPAWIRHVRIRRMISSWGFFCLVLLPIGWLGGTIWNVFIVPDPARKRDLVADVSLLVLGFPFAFLLSCVPYLLLFVPFLRLVGWMFGVPVQTNWTVDRRAGAPSGDDSNELA
jgi:hypothetical protein